MSLRKHHPSTFCTRFCAKSLCGNSNTIDHSQLQNKGAISYWLPSMNITKFQSKHLSLVMSQAVSVVHSPLRLEWAFDPIIFSSHRVTRGAGIPTPPTRRYLTHPLTSPYKWWSGFFTGRPNLLIYFRSFSHLLTLYFYVPPRSSEIDGPVGYYNSSLRHTSTWSCSSALFSHVLPRSSRRWAQARDILLFALPIKPQTTSLQTLHSCSYNPQQVDFM